jgi:branched-chain amino acid transport system substrate-binding protein
VLRSGRALALVSVAGIAAIAIAGCSSTSSSSNNSSLTIPGKTLGIVISAPKGYKFNIVEDDIVKAEQLAFQAHKGQVTKFTLVDGPPFANGTLSDNARASIIAENVVAYLGEIQPGASDQTIGITNDLGVLQVSPTDTALELGQTTPAVSGGPKTFFQQWTSFGRTFARVVPTSAQEAQAQVTEMKDLNVSSLYVASDTSYYGEALADAIRSAAHTDGVNLTHDETSAGAIFYAGLSPSRSAAFFNKAAGANSGAKLFGTSALNSSTFTSAVSSAAAKNLYVTTPGFMPKDLPAGGKKFVQKFKQAYGHAPNGEAIFGYEAMTAVIADLAKLGTRANVRKDVVNGFLHSKFSGTVLGSYSINSSGNTSLDAFVWNKLSGGQLVPFKTAAA